MVGPRPESGGVPDAFVSERASATPIAPPAASETPDRRSGQNLERGSRSGVAGGGQKHGQERSATPRPVAGPLSLLEAWLSTVITHPDSAEAGARRAASIATALAVDEIEQIVRPGPRLSSIEGLGLYHYAYHARLVECLADDYPIAKHALGDTKFGQLARRYIEAHPSRGPNLNGYGRAFASFCASDGQLQERAFVADLARLEWAMVEVIHAPASAALSMAFLQEIGPERWSGVTLPPSSTLRFLELDHPVNAYLQAVRTGGAPEIPSPAWSATAVYRQGYTVWRMDLTRPMAGVLRSLLRGETLGEALQTLAAYDRAFETDVMAWFRAWVSGEFFGKIDLRETGSQGDPS